MARRYNDEITGSVAVIVAIIGGPFFLVYMIQNALDISQMAAFKVLGGIVVLGVIILGVSHLSKAMEKNKRMRAIQIENIDLMSGVEFERYLQALLTSQGYAVTLTKASGDLGVDLIACRRRERIAIQVKRHTHRISRRAVSDAVTGKQHYKCATAMVITNSFFTPGAATLAHSTDCKLVDRDTLTEWILRYQKSRR